MHTVWMIARVLSVVLCAHYYFSGGSECRWSAAPCNSSGSVKEPKAAPTPIPTVESISSSLADQDGVPNDGAGLASMRLEYFTLVDDLCRREGCDAWTVHELVESMIRKINDQEPKAFRVNCLKSLTALSDGAASKKHRKLIDIATAYEASQMQGNDL